MKELQVKEEDDSRERKGEESRERIQREKEKEENCGKNHEHVTGRRKQGTSQRCQSFSSTYPSGSNMQLPGIFKLHMRTPLSFLERVNLCCEQSSSLETHQQFFTDKFRTRSTEYTRFRRTSYFISGCLNIGQRHVQEEKRGLIYHTPQRAAVQSRAVGAPIRCVFH